jgi:hypothetical protein
MRPRIIKQNKRPLRRDHTVAVVGAGEGDRLHIRLSLKPAESRGYWFVRNHPCHRLVSQARVPFQFLPLRWSRDHGAVANSPKQSFGGISKTLSISVDTD